MHYLGCLGNHGLGELCRNQSPILIAKAIGSNGATTQGVDAALNHMTITTGDGTYNFTPTDHSGLSVDQVAIARDQNGTLVPTEFTKAMIAKTS